MNLEAVMQELEALSTEKTKKNYKNQGAQEPLFGTAAGAMKPLFRKIKKNQPLADELYQTGNYDAMYFAGMIADPDIMTEADFERWMESAYFYMISDYIVAVTLVETDFAQELADKWIASDKELYMSAGWSCYCWLLGSRPDTEFDKDKILQMLSDVEKIVHSQPGRAKYSMNNFISSVGISYLPLHKEALHTAKKVGKVEIDMGKTKCSVPNALDYIKHAADKDKIGFKRKYVRC